MEFQISTQVFFRFQMRKNKNLHSKLEVKFSIHISNQNIRPQDDFSGKLFLYVLPKCLKCPKSLSSSYPPHSPSRPLSAPWTPSHNLPILYFGDFSTTIVIVAMEIAILPVELEHLFDGGSKPACSSGKVIFGSDALI